MDIAENRGELDGKEDPKAKFYGLGTVCDGHGLQDKAGSAGHAQIEGCQVGEEAIPQPWRLVACGAGTDRGFA